MRMMATVVLLSAFFQTTIPPEADSPNPQWVRKDYTDSFTGTKLVSFTLLGRFLDPPQRGHSPNPVWITVCQPKPTHTGKDLFDGLLVKSYIDFGTVLASLSDAVRVVYRLDDGKPQTDVWLGGTADDAAFLPRMALDTVLYGHYLPHRANSNPPTKKLVIKLDEFSAASIVAEFDIPDPDEMARACGTTYHKA